MAEFELLSVVALTEDLTVQGLLRGQVGTIVEEIAPGVYEVEFSDDAGETYAMVPVRSALLMQLHHEPKTTRHSYPPAFHSELLISILHG